MSPVTATRYTLDITAAAGETLVARYSTYGEAQRAVDHLSDAGFPVEEVSIVSANLRLVEQVTGRFTGRRAAAVGAVDGALFGLLMALFVGLFASGAGWVALLLAGPTLGAGLGALSGYLTYRMQGGRRDFSADQFLAARHYDVIVEAPLLGRARQILEQAGLLPA